MAIGSSGRSDAPLRFGRNDVVVFDLDDTLYSEYEFCRSAYQEIASVMHIRYAMDAAYIEQMMMSHVMRRLNPFDALESYCRGEQVDIDVRHYVEVYRNHCPHTLPFAPFARELLEHLKSNGVAMALITDGRVNTQTAKIKALSLCDFIDEDNIVISEATGYDKYSPENFQLIAKRHSDAHRFVYIGDNPCKDFIHPNAMGWLSIRIIHDFPLVQTIPDSLPESSLPQVTIRDFSQLL